MPLKKKQRIQGKKPRTNERYGDFQAQAMKIEENWTYDVWK